MDPEDGTVYAATRFGVSRLGDEGPLTGSPTAVRTPWRSPLSGPDNWSMVVTIAQR